MFLFKEFEYHFKMIKLFSHESLDLFLMMLQIQGSDPDSVGSYLQQKNGWMSHNHIMPAITQLQK